MPPAPVEDFTMIMGLLLCLAVLAVQLVVLHYIDLRVATMVPLEEPASVLSQDELADDRLGV
ncbi:hypothetical protein [Halomonas urumqiensis]|uniref:hypothetical protein n=1 Tax=Halomonas urumqiensis TaxID=1684789 RepID=UPI0011AF4455|nr:hypothetical protein [Halomonas urumqiensis]